MKTAAVILLLDIGNTHTHLGLADRRRVFKHADIRTTGWFDETAPATIEAFVAGRQLWQALG